jgi:SAM-dependent methyltransferase
LVSSRGSQFSELAEYYDAFNGWKDYAKEAKRLVEIAQHSRRTRSLSWLDVACGTGRHLAHLRRNHSVIGVDASPEMLRIARRRLPGVRLVLGDMRTFDLHRRFDVVSCLFSAIGHLHTKRDVRTTFANLARHLNPGGVAIVEPWLEPSAFRPGTVHLRTHQSPKLIAVRCAYSSRRGIHSIVDYHFLIAKPGRGIRHYAVRDVGLLLSRAELVAQMEAAGLRSRYLGRGFMPGRGLIVGRKPTRQ